MYKKLTSILFVLLFTSGCMIHSSDPVRKAEIYTCKMQCLKRFQHCQQVCDNNCGHCVTASKHRVINQFQRYVKRQAFQGKEVPRDLKSYRDPLQCRKITCNCVADVEQCTQFCIGNIHKHLQVAPTCC